MPVSKYTGLAYLNIGRKVSGFLRVKIAYLRSLSKYRLYYIHLKIHFVCFLEKNIYHNNAKTFLVVDSINSTTKNLRFNATYERSKSLSKKQRKT